MRIENAQFKFKKTADDGKCATVQAIYRLQAAAFFAVARIRQDEDPKAAIHTPYLCSENPTALVN